MFLRIRSLLSVLLAFCLLLSAACVLAEEEDSSWAKENLPRERDPLPIEIVPYDQLPPVIDGQHHYLMLCVDTWDVKKRPEGAPMPTYDNGSRKDAYGNTDGIVLVTLDTRAKRIMLTSFIREELVQRPDGKIGRINRIYNDYGPEALCKTISEHIGVRIEKYILFGFSQVKDIVDYLGGVDVYLDSDEISYLHRYRVPVNSVISVDGKYDVYRSGTCPEGMYHLTRAASVYYMRIRKAGGGGDFMRTARVREVLSSLADKCRTISWEEVQALVNTVMENNNTTNINLDEMMQAASYAYGLRDCTIEELRIPVDKAVRPITYAGMMTEEVNWPMCRLAMDNYLQSSFLVMDDEDE